MYRVLTVVAVVAMLALGTSIVTAVVDHTTMTRQSGQIASLDQEESADHKAIAELRKQMRSHTASAYSAMEPSAVVDATSLAVSHALGAARFDVRCVSELDHGRPKSGSPITLVCVAVSRSGSRTLP